jgi:hypothetical protein
MRWLAVPRMQAYHTLKVWRVADRGWDAGLWDVGDQGPQLCNGGRGSPARTGTRDAHSGDIEGKRAGLVLGSH